jgi:hypothetical protein
MLWLATAHAQNSAAPTTTDSVTDEDYAISSVALTDVFGKGKPEKLVLIDQTSIGFPPGMAAMTQFGGKAQPLLARVPKDAKDQFDTRNKGHQKIDGARLKTAFDITLVSPEDAEKMVAGGGGWESFRKKYPKSPGVTLISLPGINSEHTRALLYVGDSCDMLCGNGYFILLGKDGEQWKVLQKVMIWIS